jgi:hypothetical protein
MNLDNDDKDFKIEIKLSDWQKKASQFKYCEKCGSQMSIVCICTIKEKKVNY